MALRDAPKLPSSEYGEQTASRELPIPPKMWSLLQLMESTQLVSTSQRPNFVFRISIKAGVAMGPGKAELLRAIESCGSITAAAKQLDMSYRRAWMLVQSMNEHFQKPLVETGRGGATRGGAVVTPAGHAVLALYEAMQAEAEKVVTKHTKAFGRLLK